MNKYETTFIVSPELDEAAVQEVIEKVKGIVANNKGEVENIDNWGVKKLAYEVKKHRTGNYFCMHMNGVAATVDELSRNFRIMDSIIKFMVIRLED